MDLYPCNQLHLFFSQPTVISSPSHLSKEETAAEVDANGKKGGVEITAALSTSLKCRGGGPGDTPDSQQGEGQAQHSPGCCIWCGTGSSWPHWSHTGSTHSCPRPPGTPGRESRTSHSSLAWGETLGEALPGCMAARWHCQAGQQGQGKHVQALTDTTVGAAVHQPCLPRASLDRGPVLRLDRHHGWDCHPQVLF